MRYIINPLDQRYQSLNEIFEKYNWDNLVSVEGRLSVAYFIPPELVIEEHEYAKGFRVLKELDPHDDWCNWSYSKSIATKLWDACRLTPQDYFDLLILHINDKDLRPKCHYCGDSIEFSGRIYYGYSKTLPWNQTDHIFCSKSCSASYQSSHLEEFPESAKTHEKWISARYKPKNKVYNDMISYISRGNPEDEVHLYAAFVDDYGFKIGLTTDIESRANMFYSELTNMHSILSTNRLEAAYIEARIKLRIEGKETVNISESHKIFKIIKEILATRPVTNPFD